MGRQKLEVKGYTAEEIKSLLRKDEKYSIGVKLYAVYQIANGAVSRDLEKLYNVSFKSVYNWVHEFNENGIEGLKNKPKSGRKPKLSEEVKESIKTIILNDEPSKYNYNTSTWTGPILIDFIYKSYGVSYKKAQIYNILKSMGLSFQKGKGVYPEADEEMRKDFIKELKKKQEMKRSEEVILFEDECSISNTATISYSWNIKGKQPIIQQKQRRRERQTMFGCVEPETGKVVAKRSDKGNAQTFKYFLSKVLHEYKDKRIIMVLDNVRYHHSKKIKKYLINHKDRIELLFLPPYSPDLNPMERIWWYMRKKITHNRYIMTMPERIACFWRMFSHFKNKNEKCKELSKLCVYS